MEWWRTSFKASVFHTIPELLRKARSHAASHVPVTTAFRNDSRRSGVCCEFYGRMSSPVESIDYDTLGKEIDWLFSNGARGIVMAMVSEVLRLSGREREELAARSCALARGRGPATISVGAESSHAAEGLARRAEACGTGALMAIPPVATRAPAEELAEYYRRLIEAVRIPVIVQDASGYVGQTMSIAFQAELMDRFGPERVWEKGNVSYPEEDTPQGGVISPLFSNIHLHEVLDKWFVESVQPACGGGPSWCDGPMTLSWALSGWRMFTRSSG